MSSSDLNVQLIQGLASLVNHCCQCHVRDHHDDNQHHRDDNQHHQDDNQHQKSYIIRHQKSLLVLDASEYQVKLQHFTGSTPQQWLLEHTDSGIFIIVNKKNGHALDIECSSTYDNIITYEKHGRINQQWFINSDRTIQCPEDSLVLEVAKSDYAAGTKIMAKLKSGKENQQFLLQRL